MVSSGTTITHSHPRPSPLSGLQVQTQGTTNTNNKASPPTNISSPSPVSVSVGHAHSHSHSRTHSGCKDDSASMTNSVATAISFATPENSPFLTNKKSTVLSNTRDHSNNELNNNNYHRNHSNINIHNNNIHSAATNSMEGSECVMRATVTVPSSSNNRNTSTKTSTILAQSVTPQEKSAKHHNRNFNGDHNNIHNNIHNNHAIGGRLNKIKAPSSDSLLSMGTAHTQNIHSSDPLISDADTTPDGSGYRSYEKSSFDSKMTITHGHAHSSPPILMSNQHRTFVTSPLSRRDRSPAQQTSAYASNYASALNSNKENLNRVLVQAQASTPVPAPSLTTRMEITTGTTRTTAPNSTAAITNATSTSRRGLIPSTSTSSHHQYHHSQEVPQTFSVTTPSSLSSSSPSRIPSLQPRKVSETMSQQQQQHMNVTATNTVNAAVTAHANAHANTSAHGIVSSACSDAGSIPPSLCSSTCSPQNDGKEDEKQRHQQQHQQLGRGHTHATNAHGAGISTGAGSGSGNVHEHIKVENDAQQVMMIKMEPSPCDASTTNNHNNTRVGGTNSLNADNIHRSNNLYNPQQNNNNNSASTTAHHKSSKKKNNSANNSGVGPAYKNRVASPVPPMNSRPPQARTPVRSPVSRYGNGQRLHVDIAPFGSPGMFLSPYLPSPPDSRKAGIGISNGAATSAGQKSTTPTNFAKDFGRGDLESCSFDATNALPWLSPTAYSLFSPGGGIASAINTPGGLFSSSMHQTPRTPNGTRLSLPLTTDAVGSDSKKKTSGFTSMICVSPLASRKSSIGGVSSKGGEKVQNSVGNNGATRGNLQQPDTPINFKEVFASPKTDSRGIIRAEQSNEIPTLGHPNEAASNEELSSRLSLEKHMAERDVREDEDLNVLLKLAETTPNRSATESKQNSRSFRNQVSYNDPAAMYSLPNGGDPPPSLHLPYIGKHGTSNSVGKGRKKKSGGARSDEFTPPPLPIRSTTNSTSPSKISKNADKSRSKVQKKKGSLHQNTRHPPKPVYSYPGAPSHVHHPPAYPHPPPPHYMHPSAYYSYPSQHPGHPSSGHPPPPPTYPTIYANVPVGVPLGSTPDTKKLQKSKGVVARTTGLKRPANSPNTEARKRTKKTSSRKGGKRTRTIVTQPLSGPEREKSAATITAINAATGNKNDKAASLASAILRGVTMRPSGKWQAQLYYAGKSRYIGVFDTREKAALAYEIAREKLKTDKPASEQSAQSIKETEANVNAARKAAFAGVNEKDPRNAAK